MGYYDNITPETQQKAGLAGFIFMLVVCLLFVVGKIFGYLAWNWLWVFCPVWGPLVVGLLLLVLGVKPPNM